jgi:hypothetical protein
MKVVPNEQCFILDDRAHAVIGTARQNGRAPVLMKRFRAGQNHFISYRHQRFSELKRVAFEHPQQSALKQSRGLTCPLIGYGHRK